MKKLISVLMLIMATMVVSCKKENIEPNQGYTHGGTVPTVSTPSDIIGTKWELYQYKDASTTSPQPRQDTIIFLNSTQYTYNGIQSTYSLYSTNGSYNLTLNGTPFGNLSGSAPTNFIQYGEIIDKIFTDIAVGSGSPQYHIWMKKI